jgi:hypothetical protein
LVKLTRTALNLFFNGQILIKDSMNREWNFTNVIDGMKVDTNELEKFLEDEK